MVRFLSQEWVAALDDAARNHAGLAEATRRLRLTVQQEVDRGPGQDPVTWHIAFEEGVVRVRSGAPPEPATVRFHQDLATARAIAGGEESPQRAFMVGRLQVGGDLRQVVEHQDVLVHLDDVFATVRAHTDLQGDDPEAADA